MAGKKKVAKKGKVKPKTEESAPSKPKGKKAQVKEAPKKDEKVEKKADSKAERPRKTKANRFKEAMEAEEAEEPGEETEPRGVVFLGRIPRGFLEDQMKKYFSQFGEVTRFRLMRSRKTGGSKGYGFIEFRQESVAKIVAQTMHNYMIGDKTLVCEFKPKEECHKLFKGWREHIPDPRPGRREKQIASYNHRPMVEVDGQAVPQLTQQQVQRRGLQKKKLKAKLKEMEIDYDLDDILGGGVADDEAEDGENKQASGPTKQEPEEKTQPKKKKRRTAAASA